MSKKRTSTAASYTRDGEWGGYTIHHAATGWVLDGWSRRQGTRTGARYLLPYGTLGMGRDTDLAAPCPWDAHDTNGERLRAAIAGDDDAGRPLARILRKGHIVQ